MKQCWLPTTCCYNIYNIFRTGWLYNNCTNWNQHDTCIKVSIDKVRFGLDILAIVFNISVSCLKLSHETATHKFGSAVCLCVYIIKLILVLTLWFICWGIYLYNIKSLFYIIMKPDFAHVCTTNVHYCYHYYFYILLYLFICITALQQNNSNSHTLQAIKLFQLNPYTPCYRKEHRIQHRYTCISKVRFLVEFRIDQGSCPFCEIKFHDFSMENQWNSMTFLYQRKVKSYANWWKFLHLQALFKLSLNNLTHLFYFSWLFHDLWHFSSFPWLFQVFHDRTNPARATRRLNFYLKTLTLSTQFPPWLSWLPG